VYAGLFGNYVNLLVDNINTMNNDTEALLESSSKVRLEVKMQDRNHKHG
jgi:hypothetical protein